MTPARLAALHERAFDGQGRPWSEAEFHALLQDNGVFLMHSVHGFALGRQTGPEAELLTLAVDPAAQRQGVGHQLMHEFDAALTARGIETVFLEVAQDNAAALALYARTGFIQVGQRAGYYHRPDGRVVDALVLRKEMATPQTD